MSDVREFFASQAAKETDKADALRRAKETMAGPIPLIPDAPDCLVLLPRGLWDRSGFKKVATVRELTGADEEALAKVRDSTGFYDMVIALGVESVDDLTLTALPTAERQGLLRTLLIGERDQLLMGIVKATFGDKREIGFRCTLCEAEQDLTLYLSQDFKPKEVENVDAAFFTFTTSKGQEIEYRLVTGDDQHEALSRKGASVAEQNTIILSKVILKAGGTLVVNPLVYVRQMSMRDRQQLLSDLVDRQPLIDLTVRTTCAACGGEQTLPLDWGNLFRA